MITEDWVSGGSEWDYGSLSNIDFLSPAVRARYEAKARGEDISRVSYADGEPCPSCACRSKSACSQCRRIRSKGGAALEFYLIGESSGGWRLVN